MWRALLVVVAASVVAGQFNPADESDYIDNVNEYETVSKSVWVSDIISTVSVASTEKTKKVQDEIEKLLGQQIFQYEAPTAPDESLSSGRVPTRSPTGANQSNTGSDIPWMEPYGHFSSSKKNKKTRGRHRTEEVVYSVRVPQWENNPPQRRRPGVIESIVKAHEVSRYEKRIPPGFGTPTRTYGEPARTYRDPKLTYRDSSRTYGSTTPTSGANRTAYNEGGFRYRTTQMYDDNLNVLQNPDARRYLVTVPGSHLTTSRRRWRPTPVSIILTTKPKFTRRTHRHPNCTDSYYDCLLKCFDRKGYRVRCPWDTTTRPEPNRLNFTGLFHAVHRWRHMTDYDVSNIFWSWNDQLVQKGYRSCRTFTPTTTTTPPPLSPMYYDDYLSNKTGTIVAKCWVCGLMQHGIPRDSYCADNFGDVGSALALVEKATYRRYCRYMDEVPLWFNRSDPFSVWGPWTGGCTVRWLDLSGLYTQRACRSKTVPALGNHFLSKRMASLELSLIEVDDGCIVSPMATLVPFSRSISLYARFHVCVCKGSFCNQASNKNPSLFLMFILPSLSFTLFLYTRFHICKAPLSRCSTRQHRSS